ncbi:hypothetical protein SRABI112_02931 [Pseudomonas mediterranea]|nr:hypothetical protein [Pseudomonas mediterranea]CAH0243648.1 hypothetical protein SRABI112_02931 [Pseudomonas mediterranea]
MLIFNRTEAACNRFTACTKAKKSLPWRSQRHGHRGAQKHINEISWVFEDCAAEWGTLPSDEFSAGRFDGDMNNTPRGSKGHKDYYFPGEEMIIHWLRRYGGLDEPSLHNARERRIEVKREMWAFERQLAQDAL